MNFNFLDRRSAERFAELLDETSDRHRYGQIRADHGDDKDELAELVAIGNSLSAAKPGVRVDPEFRVGLRAMLVATAERDGIGRTASDPAADPVTEEAPATAGAGRGFLSLGGRRIRARGAIIIGVAAGALAVSGISAASENASPGDALYGVKRSTERAQLAMAGSDVTRGQLSLDFARTRLTEATAMPGGSAAFGGVLDDMDNDTRTGVRLLTTSAVAHIDSKPLSTVETFADSQRQELAPELTKLTEDNRSRALESITLLDEVRQRAEDLRAALSCHSITSIGSDELGPKLRGCASQPDSATPAVRPSRTGKAGNRSSEQGGVTPKKKAGPSVTPSVTDEATPPATYATLDPANQGVVPSMSNSDSPAATTDDSNVLGGVLGGMTGSESGN